MRLLLFVIAVVLVVFGCAGFEDFTAAVQEGAPVLAPAAPHVPGALAGNPYDIINIGSYAANAALAGWAAWERRKRLKG